VAVNVVDRVRTGAILDHFSILAGGGGSALLRGGGIRPGDGAKWPQHLIESELRQGVAFRKDENVFLATAGFSIGLVLAARGLTMIAVLFLHLLKAQKT